MKLVAFAERDEFIAGLGPERLEALLDVLGHLGRGQDAAGEAGRHVKRAIDEIAEVVGELAVVADEELLAREVAVLADVHLADQEIAECIGPEFGDKVERIERIARALGHLGAALQPPAVDDESLGQREAGRVQHNRPVDGMRRHEDVLADDVVRLAPDLRAVRHGRVVIDERIEPHVGDVARVERQRDAPLEALLRP